MRALVALCLLSSAAWAADKKATPPIRFSCEEVRKAVKEHGAATVESWARAQGYPEFLIRLGRRCLG